MLTEHSDFKDEKSMIEHMLMDKGHVPFFMQNFHPELNPIESVGSTEEIYQGAL